MDEAELNAMTNILSSSEVTSGRKTEQLVLLASFLSVDITARSAAIANSVSLPLLFSCLQSSDQRQVAACCTVLKKLVTNLAANDFLKGELLESGLEHASSEVRQLCVFGARRSLESEASSMELLESNLGKKIVKLIADEDLLCSQAAADFLKEAARQFEPCARLLLGEPGLLKDLSTLLAISSIVRYRLLAMVSELCTASKVLLSACHGAGLLKPLLDDLGTDDVLVRLNAVEVLGTFVRSSFTVDYLREQNIFKLFGDIISTADTDPMGQFILPGIFKFFGLLCDGGYIEVCSFHEQYPMFLDSTLSLLEAQAPPLYLQLMDTVALVCRSRGGADLVLNHDRCQAAFASLCSSIRVGPSAARGQALITMRVILSIVVQPDVPLSTDSTVRAEQNWYRPISTRTTHDPATAVWSFAKDPSVDVRCAAFGLLATMVKLPFAVNDIMHLPGFVEYLVDRATETETRAWEAKYVLVKVFTASETVVSSLDAPNLLLLRTYVRQGPLYVRGQLSVKLDDEYE